MTQTLGPDYTQRFETTSPKLAEEMRESHFLYDLFKQQIQQSLDAAGVPRYEDCGGLAKRPLTPQQRIAWLHARTEKAVTERTDEAIATVIKIREDTGWCQAGCPCPCHQKLHPALVPAISALNHPTPPVWCEHYSRTPEPSIDHVFKNAAGRTWVYHYGNLPDYSPCCGHPRPENPL